MELMEDYTIPLKKILEYSKTRNTQVLDKCTIQHLILCTFGITPLLNTEDLQLQKPISSLSDENISSVYFLFADEHIALLTLTEVCVYVGMGVEQYKGL